MCQADLAQTSGAEQRWYPSAGSPYSMPGSPFTGDPNTAFTGPGAVDAGTSVTGMTANCLLTQTRRNIDERIARRRTQGWKGVAQELSAEQGRRESPSWDGKDLGRTLRAWLKTQLMWQFRTPHLQNIGVCRYWKHCHWELSQEPWQTPCQTWSSCRSTATSTSCNIS